MALAQGLSLIVSDGQSVVGIPASVRGIYSGVVAGVPVPIVVALIAYLAFHGLLYHTRFGTYIFALGGNREALRYAGRSPNRLLIMVYAIGGAMAGIAGLLMTRADELRASDRRTRSRIRCHRGGGRSAARRSRRGNGWAAGHGAWCHHRRRLRNGLNRWRCHPRSRSQSVGILVIVALFFDGLRSRS